ncbi:MAG: hypothetical protein J5722_07120 [Oscillospiraceae bacterium]|nr:hypothetical protein [Oscillospiraceae bacterium]
MVIGIPHEKKGRFTVSESYFTYKTRPVVRSGKTIYYGSMAQPYVVMMTVTAEAEENQVMTASEIKCYLMKTDKSLNPMEAITKTAVRPTLYEALELAAAWLKSTERSA